MKKIVLLSALLFLMLSSCAVFAGGTKEKAAPAVKESVQVTAPAASESAKPAPVSQKEAAAPASVSAPAAEPVPVKRYFPYGIVSDSSVSIAALSDLYSDSLRSEIAVPENLVDEISSAYPEIAKNLVAVPSAEEAENAVKDNSFLVALLPSSYKAELTVLSLEL